MGLLRVAASAWLSVTHSLCHQCDVLGCSFLTCCDISLTEDIREEELSSFENSSLLRTASKASGASNKGGSIPFDSRVGRGKLFF